MSKKSTGLFLLLCALLLLTAPGTAAQQARPDTIYRAEDSFYFKGRLGGNFYGGDRDQNAPNNFLDAPFAYFGNEQIGVTLGLEAGYHFTERFSLGLMYLSGNYPRVKDDQDKQGTPYQRPAYPVINPVTTSTVRHHFSVIGRSHMSPRGRVSPYGHIGFHLSFGKINDKTRTGVGPVAGIGLDYWVSDRVGLFLEINGVFVFDDEALDLADTKAKGTPDSPRGIDASDFDSFSFFGIGVRYTLYSPPSVPVRIACRGPRRLNAGEVGTFAAEIINEDATRPLTYRWNFGDGSEPLGALASHAFSQPDSFTVFTVTVTASNATGEDTAVCPVRVDKAVRVACIGPRRLNAGEVGIFAALINRDAPRPVDIHWDFGDNSTTTNILTVSDTVTVKHSFVQPDSSFTVTVTASNPKGEDTDRAVCPVRVECEEVDLKEIFFKRNTSVLDSTRGLVEILETNADIVMTILKNCPSTPVEIKVYASCSECTSDDECQGRNSEELADDRASAIKKVYTRKGIREGNIKITKIVEACDQ